MTIYFCISWELLKQPPKSSECSHKYLAAKQLEYKMIRTVGDPLVHVIIALCISTAYN